MKFRQVVRELEEKPPKTLAKFSILFFLVSCLVGFSAGLFFREIRLNRLSARQKAQAIQEDNAIHSLFEKFSQNKAK